LQGRSAAQRCVETSPDAVVPYMMATGMLVAMIHNAPPLEGPLAMLLEQASLVAMQILSSLLGAWLSAMVGVDSSADKLLAAATLGLVMVWLANRSLISTP
jgi:hypothetical protein